MSHMFQEVERFLQGVRHPSLFSYLSLAPDADTEAVEQTLQARRVWAQAQQANPRHRDEALWIIRNRRLLHCALVEQRVAYLQSLARRRTLRALAHVRHFITIMGANPDTLPTIRAYARRSGLSERLIEKLIEREAPDAVYSSPVLSAGVA